MLNYISSKKIFKIFSKSILICTIFILFSCRTTIDSVPVFGESKIKINSIYNEYLTLADSYVEVEKYDLAEKYYKKAMNKKDLYWGVYYKLAKVYALENKWDEASEMYKTILKKDPENSTIKASIAYIYAMQGNVKEARSIYETLLKEHPENQEYLENYIAILFLDKDLVAVSSPLSLLKRDFPDSPNIKKFESQIENIQSEKLKSNQ